MVIIENDTLQYNDVHPWWLSGLLTPGWNGGVTSCNCSNYDRDQYDPVINNLSVYCSCCWIAIISDQPGIKAHSCRILRYMFVMHLIMLNNLNYIIWQMTNKLEVSSDKNNVNMFPATRVYIFCGTVERILEDWPKSINLNFKRQVVLARGSITFTLT